MQQLQSPTPPPQNPKMIKKMSRTITLPEDPSDPTAFTVPYDAYDSKWHSKHLTSRSRRSRQVIKIVGTFSFLMTMGIVITVLLCLCKFFTYINFRIFTANNWRKFTQPSLLFRLVRYLQANDNDVTLTESPIFFPYSPKYIEKKPEPDFQYLCFEILMCDLESSYENSWSMGILNKKKIRSKWTFYGKIVTLLTAVQIQCLAYKISQMSSMKTAT